MRATVVRRNPGFFTICTQGKDEEGRCLGRVVIPLRGTEGYRRAKAGEKVGVRRVAPSARPTATEGAFRKAPAKRAGAPVGAPAGPAFVGPKRAAKARPGGARATTSTVRDEPFDERGVPRILTGGEGSTAYARELLPIEAYRGMFIRQQPDGRWEIGPRSFPSLAAARRYADEYRAEHGGIRYDSPAPRRQNPIRRGGSAGAGYRARAEGLGRARPGPSRYLVRRK